MDQDAGLDRLEGREHPAKSKRVGEAENQAGSEQNRMSGRSHPTPDNLDSHLQWATATGDAGKL